MDRIFISTAIPYVNGRPHLGHALEFVQADVLARFWRLKNKDVFFLSGTDENAMKNARAAEEKNIPIKEFVIQNSKIFEELIKAYNISNNDFIKTSQEERHIKGSQKFWLSLKKEDIYKRDYQGNYCYGCEEFKPEKELINGFCPEHPNRLIEKVSEENYFFRLSRYQKELEDLIISNKLLIVPETRKNETLSFIRSGLDDFSISRSIKRTKGWGIPVPDDAQQIIYVWVDALSNYINALGYAYNDEKFKNYWLEAEKIIHIIGKGVNRFHTVYWPALLLSAGLRLPDCVYVHGYINIEGRKMSKSIGKIIDPFDLVKKYGTDAVRYYLLREVPAYGDGDFSEIKFKERYIADLQKGLGNFSSRVTTLAEKLGDFKWDKEVEKETEEKINNVKKIIDSKLQEFKFHEAVAAVWDLISFGDLYLTQKQPWRDFNKKVIINALTILDNLSALILPFLPQTSEKIKKSINWFSQDIVKVNKISNLFPKKNPTLKSLGWG